MNKTQTNMTAKNVLETNIHAIKWALELAFNADELGIEGGASSDRWTCTAHTQQAIDTLNHIADEPERLLCVVKDHHGVIPYGLGDKPSRLLWRVCAEDHVFTYHHDQSSDALRRSNQRAVDAGLGSALEGCECGECAYELDYSSRRFIYWSPCGALDSTVQDLEGALSDYPALCEDDLFHCAQCEELFLEEDSESMLFCCSSCEEQHKEDHSSECGECGDKALDPDKDNDHLYSEHDDCGDYVKRDGETVFLCTECKG